MRDSKKNQVKIWYALRNVSTEKDEWGNTKDVTTYSSPEELKISISANKGEASAQAFGADLQYDREMVTHNMLCPIDEYSRLWIDERSILNDGKVKTEGNSIVFDMSGISVETEGNKLKIRSSAFTASGADGAISISVFKTHNYEVAAVSKSLNCIRYAIRRVNVSR